MKNNWITKLKQALGARAVVLMYHRIGTPKSDPWQLAVRPQYFEEHLQVLQKMGVAESAPAMVQQLQDDRLKRSVVITFDDGYADNYQLARPLLEQYALPATFFLPSTAWAGKRSSGGMNWSASSCTVLPCRSNSP
ncbi:polysaccharide deacetylase family protein [Cesiribacter andamanensis]|uniref:Outer membrane N-deacetylase n=1 Tax=Cesiribacter andamanensis AMV16 TaxID=1279009 RepID=M7NRD7_9BACT|nr:polysaccharide deacetylase family protein [Cesiribacter andamanensis]EMR01079.1 outer membrane N-deacetylase [Cesiribacter andamanensis AMV16]